MGLLQQLVVLQVLQWFVKVDARIRREMSPRLKKLILNNNQLQLLHGKGIHRRPLMHLSVRYAHERSFVPLWKVIGENRRGNSFIFGRFLMVVDLHEDSSFLDRLLVAKAISLA